MKRIVCAFLLCALLLLPSFAAPEPLYLAMTFDDGPSGHFTARLLDALEERGVPATFFICGYRVEQFQTLTGRIAEAGHEIGMHGDSHQFFTQMSAQGVCRDLCEAEEKIEKATGQKPTLLRPPGGKYDTSVLRQSICADLPIILWSLDTDDWRRTDTNAIAAQIVRNAKNGDIILMHDMSDSSVDAALKAIDELQARGFQFVTVSQLAALSGTALSGCEVYHRFCMEKKDAISE